MMALGAPWGRMGPDTCGKHCADQIRAAAGMSHAARIVICDHSFRAGLALNLHHARKLQHAPHLGLPLLYELSFL